MLSSTGNGVSALVASLAKCKVHVSLVATITAIDAEKFFVSLRSPSVTGLAT